MTVTVGGRSAPPRIDHERPEHANHAHHVAEDLALVPARGGFVAPLREAEVECAREELLAAVQTTGLQQLLGADDAERIEQLAADDVLPALAAIERQIRDARVIAAGCARQKRRVFIVGMRAGVQHAGRRLQSLQQLHQAGRAGVVDGTDLRVGVHEQNRGAPDERGQESDHARATGYFGNAPRGRPGISLSAFSK